MDQEERLWKKGNIVRIKMHNFMTYNDVEVYPGKSLNVIVGPNGVGKSTIMCAISLGLAGTTKDLERSDSIADFVKNDKQKGYVEIELFSIPSKVVIRRVMEKANNSSHWLINGEKKKLADVKAIISEMNIKINNLCTFLPQDKVGRFTEMDNIELLHETEKALSYDMLYLKHQMLIKMQKDVVSCTSSKEELEKRLEELTATQDRFQVELEKQNERKEALRTKDLYEKKLVWKEVVKHQDETRLLKEAHRLAKNNLKEKQKEIEPLQEKLTGLKRECERKKTRYSKYIEMMNKHKKERDEKRDLFDKVDQEIADHRSVLQNLDERREKKRRELEREQNIFESRKEELGNINQSKLTAEKESLSRDDSKIRGEINSLQNQLYDKKDALLKIKTQYDSTSEQLKRLKDVSQQRYQKLKKCDSLRGAKDACEALNWIRENRSLFRDEVVGPVALDVTVENDTVGMYLEQHVPKWCLVTFIAQNKHDYDKVYDELIKKRSLKINVSMISAEDVNRNQIKRSFSPEYMQRLKQDYGMVGYLDEFVNCSRIVKTFLVIHSMFQSVLVASDKADASMKNGELLELISHKENDKNALTAAHIFYPATIENMNGNNSGRKTVHMKYTVSVSRYSKQASTRVDKVPNNRVLGKGEDVEGINKLEQILADLHPRMSPLQQEIQGLEQEIQQRKQKVQMIASGIREISNQLAKIPSLEKTLRKQQETINLLERELESDIDEKKGRIRGNLKAAIQKVKDILVDTNNITKKLFEVSAASSGAKLNSVLMDRILSEEQSKFRELSSRNAGLQDECNRLQKEYDAKRNSYGAMLQNAREKAPLEDSQGRDTPLKALLGTVPYETAEELEAAITELELKLEEIEENGELLTLYQENQEKIVEIQQRLEEICERENGNNSVYNNTLGPWLEKLNLVLQKVNKLFTKYMGEMNCGGEIVLDTKHADLEDWGLKIMVRFRDNHSLSELSAQVQSGGERSVATILFLMALQGMMESPFRAVDEINQGMDEVNERKIISRIVANSVGKDKPQYFLVTPKLLQGLTQFEHDDVNFLLVHNGPALPDYKLWNVKKFLNIANSKRPRDENTDGNRNANRRLSR